MSKITAMCILNVEQSKFLHVKTELEKIPEIKRIVMLSGEFDMILEVEIEEMEHLWNIFVENIDPIEGIIETNTHIVMKEINQ